MINRPPLSRRHGIPIYCDKSQAECRQDKYERYDPMVIRQSRLHLADLVKGSYPMQAVMDYVVQHLPVDPQQVCEVGSGVGRLIGTLAQILPHADCYGIDYSYQMLRQAHRYWLSQESIDISDENVGYDRVIVPSRTPLSNLSLLMADATDLPLDDQSVDVVVSSFLLDRLDQPSAVLAEWQRVLKPSGRVIIATPLNWSSAKAWRMIPDIDALIKALTDTGLLVQDHKHLLIEEPIDARGNSVGWRAEIVVAEKLAS